MSKRFYGTTATRVPEEYVVDGNLGIHFRWNISAKTADYTVDVASDSSGTIFTTRGATGAIVFTLPAVTSAMSGMWYRFFNAVDQDMTVNSTADEMITFNDLDANGVAFSTTSEQIGAAIEAVCDGTSWLIFVMAEETQTMTVTS